MNRRSFLQAMSAAFGSACLGSSLIQREHQPLPIRYDLFCDPEFVRYSLGRPFAVEGSVCATNGHILILHGDNGSLTQDLPGRFPNIRKLDWSPFDKPGWKPLPKPQWYNAVPKWGAECPECLATGRIGDDVRRCEVCHGNSDNWGTLPDGTNGCPKCHYGWVGGTACHRCKPERDVDGDVTVGICYGNRVWELIDGAPFAGSKLNRIRTLSDVEYLYDPDFESLDKRGPGVLAFRFNAGPAGEGRGLVMGLTNV